MKKTILYFSFLFVSYTNLSAFNLEVQISDNEATGQIHLALYENKDTFLDIEKAKLKAILPGNSDNIYILKDIPEGKYALTLFVDMNNNGVLDKSFIGKPREPYGFSNNPSSVFGAPSFDKCIFLISENQKINIHLK